MGGSGALSYTTRGDTITIETKTLPIGTEHFTRSRESVYGQSFKCFPDSLINIATGEAFYSSAYIKKSNRVTKRNFAIYIIQNGVKYRINVRNYKRSILATLNMEDYNTVAVDAETAYKIYGVSKNYSTLQLMKK